MSTSDFGLLTTFSLLEINGPDAERFLQGQLSCDVVTLNNHHWTLGACCNAKGRMVANFMIAKIGDSFWLRLPSDNIESLKQHLSRYIVFFKAQMTIKDDWQILGNSTVDNPQPERISQPLTFQALPEKYIFTWPDGRQECWQSQHSSGASIDSEWHSADIQQGLAWVTAASQLEWIPQEIDWGVQGGVSFDKGCYTGQEIIARLQFLGKSKKQWVLLSSDTELDIKPTQSLTEPNSDKSVGTVASWNKQHGLAILNKKLQQQQLQLAEHTMTWQPLFYQDEAAPTEGATDD